MKTTAITFTVLCLFIFSLTGTASADKTVFYRNAKSIGMGGTKVAGGFNYNGFIDNPALLSRVKYVRFSIARIPFILNKDLIDLGEFISDNTDNFERFGNESLLVDENGEPLPGQENEEEKMTVEEKEAFLYDLEEFDGQWSRVRISPMVDFAVNIMDFGVGFAVYNQTEIGIKVDKGIYDPRVWGEGISNFVYVLGFAKPMSMLTPGLTVGLNMKYVQRRQASLFTISASDLGDIDETIKPVQDELKEDVQSTFMIDVGALYDIPAIDAQVGGTIKGLGDGRGSSLDLGIAKRMLSDRLILLADYIDFFDNNKENIFSKINMGAQYKLAIFALRGGIRGGYPTAGFGLNFNIFDLDLAYYTKELTKGPGGYGEDRYMLQLKFGW